MCTTSVPLTYGDAPQSSSGGNLSYLAYYFSISPLSSLTHLTMVTIVTLVSHFL